MSKESHSPIDFVEIHRAQTPRQRPRNVHPVVDHQALLVSERKGPMTPATFISILQEYPVLLAAFLEHAAEEDLMLLAANLPPPDIGLIPPWELSDEPKTS